MAPRPCAGVDDDFDKKTNKFLRRLSCALGVCCFTLLTICVLLLRVAWPSLVSTSEATRGAWPRPPASAEFPPHFVGIGGAVHATSVDFQGGFDQLDSFQPTEDTFARRASADSSSPGRACLDNSQTGSNSESSSDSHHGHAHDAMLFLFNAILIGVLVLHLTTHPKLHFIQHTSTLFVLGMAYALVQEGLKLHSKLGVLGRSYGMWMDIDPHLILFTLLPALLAGDSMAIDTSIVKRVAGQCIYLAGPGVLVGSFLTAGFIMLYLGWSFKLSLTMGAILAATDPVAVVSLLKQLGASPTLTVQIAGESLLNDGTAIVLYTMAYEMLKGKTYGPTETIIFIVRKAFCALGLGWVTGWVFVVWIQMASNRFEHHSSTIQICLTLCCAYWSFIMAEGVLDMSGVLCTVAASLVLADKMWVSITEKESMKEVWHIFDFLGNSLIFFLAGALTGDVMVHIPWVDYLHLLALYAVSMLIRAFIIFASRPILQYLSPDGQAVSRAEALIMTVGGLRGAVGLALAIQVSTNKDGAVEDEMDARRVLFYTGGIATLTLVVNASACPHLVRAVGLVNTDDTKKQMLLKLHLQMLDKASHMIHSSHVGVVLNEMMTEVRRMIDEKFGEDDDQANILLQHSRSNSVASDRGLVDHWQQTASDQKHLSPKTDHSRIHIDENRLSIDSSFSTNGFGTSRRVSGSTSFFLPGPSIRKSAAVASQTLTALFSVHHGRTKCFDGAELVSNYTDAKDMFKMVLKKHRKQLDLLDLPEAYELPEEAALIHAVQHRFADAGMLRATTVVFLSLVKAQYWHQVHHGEFIEGSSHPEVLLSSVLVPSDLQNLVDFEYIIQELGLSETQFKEESYYMQCREQRNAETSEMQRLRRDSKSSAISASSLNEKDSDGMPAGMHVQLPRGPRPPPPQTMSQTMSRSRSMSEKSGHLQEAAEKSKFFDNSETWGKLTHANSSWVHKVVQSTAFNGFITCVILANVVNVFIEESFRKEKEHDNPIWLILESCFNAVFLVEFVFKFFALRCGYFKSTWNVFDFFLIIVGVGGIIMEIWWMQSDEKSKLEDTNLSQEARIFRLNRVFRVMRLVRVFRLVRFIQIMQAKLAGNEISLELASHLRTITLLTAYARGTHEAQKELFHYFGEPKQTTVEQARCLLESQTYIFKAVSLALLELKKVDMTILKSLSVLRESGRIADTLSDFICEAQEVGVVSAREADNLLAPIQKRRSLWQHLLHDSEMGIVHRNPVSVFSGGSMAMPDVPMAPSRSLKVDEIRPMAITRPPETPPGVMSIEPDSLFESTAPPGDLDLDMWAFGKPALDKLDERIDCDEVTAIHAVSDKLEERNICDAITVIQGDDDDFNHPHSPAESPLRTTGLPCVESSR